MKPNDNPTKPMEMHGNSYSSTAIHGNPWKPVEIYGNLWEPMETHGNLRESIKIIRNPLNPWTSLVNQKTVNLFLVFSGFPETGKPENQQLENWFSGFLLFLGNWKT